jgi:hypothetical protein
VDIGRMHGLLARFSRDFSLGVLANGGVTKAVRESLAAHGKLEQRASPLAPQLVFWLVICMVLMRDRSIPAVFSALIEAGRQLFPGLSRHAVSDGALAHARERLGAQPFETFFMATTQSIPNDLWFHGLRPRAIDSFCATMPDTARNRKRFPMQKSYRGRVAWPQLRATCVVDIRTRGIIAAHMGNTREGEQTQAEMLWNAVSADDLLIEDRGFFAAHDFNTLNQRDCKFLCRMPKNVHPRLVQRLGPGDSLVELVYRRPRKPGEAPDSHIGRPSKTKVVRLIVRLIEYRLKASRVRYRLVTNVFDPNITPQEFAEVYHWRWDAEIAFDELKTHLMAVRHGKQHTIFRSKHPTLVQQEFWAMLAAYNLVRSLMGHAAATAGIDPQELSFLESLHVIEASMQIAQIVPGPDRPHIFRRLLADLAECRINRPRRPRSFPRVVKSRRTAYAVKQRHHRESALKIDIVLPAARKRVA